MSIKDFEIGKELGKGSYSSVYICKRKADGKIYALKRTKISQLTPKDRENALNEVRILASLSHTNIIDYKEAFYDNDSKTLNIVMEFANEGDLECKIKLAITKSLFLSEALIWEYLIQLLNGLKYLHGNKIVHRDIKSANIFLKDGMVKLGDLNIAKIDKLGMLLTQTGTPYYASPEIWDGKPYNYKSDIWSVGVVIYEMCALKPPFNSTSMEGLYKEVSKGVYNPIPRRYSKDLSKVISLLLQLNPDSRPSCDKLLNNDIILRNKKVSLEDSIMHDLLDTIKFPTDINELHSRLPSRRKYTDANDETEDISDESRIIEANIKHLEKQLNYFIIYNNKVIEQNPVKLHTAKYSKMQESSNSKYSTESENYSLEKTKQNVNLVYSKNIQLKLNNAKNKPKITRK